MQSPYILLDTPTASVDRRCPNTICATTTVLLSETLPHCIIRKSNLPAENHSTPFSIRSRPALISTIPRTGNYPNVLYSLHFQYVLVPPLYQQNLVRETMRLCYIHNFSLEHTLLCSIRESRIVSTWRFVMVLDFNRRVSIFTLLAFIWMPADAGNLVNGIQKIAITWKISSLLWAGKKL